MRPGALLVMALAAAVAAGQDRAPRPEAPLVAPAAGAPVAAEGAASGSGPHPTPESAFARRLHDSVAVRTGPGRTERVLYFFDPTVDLFPGDELEQGSGGLSTLVLPGGGLVELVSSGHVIVDAVSEGGDALTFPLLSRAVVVSELRPMRVVLPGGTVCAFQGTSITARVEPGRLIVRNEGLEPVEVTGMLTLLPGVTGGGGLSTQVLGQGEEVRLTLLSALTPALADPLLVWQGRVVRRAGDLAWSEEAEGLVVRGAAAQPGQPALAGAAAWVTVGGVRVAPGQGTALRLDGRTRGPASPVAPPAAAAAPPAGLVPLGDEEYFLLRQAGHAHDEILANGYWVDDATRLAYERWLSRQEPAAADNSSDATGADAEEDP